MKLDVKETLPVNLNTRRMPPRALADVSVKDGARLHVLQAELTQEQLRQPCVFLRIRTWVPSCDVKLSKLDHLGGAKVGTSRTAPLDLSTLWHWCQCVPNRCCCWGCTTLRNSHCFFPFHARILNRQKSFRLLLTFCEKLDIFLRDSSWQGRIQALFVPSCRQTQLAT